MQELGRGLPAQSLIAPRSASGTHPAAKPHSATAWAHAPAHSTCRRFIRQRNTAFLGANLHLLVMFLAELLAFLDGFRGTHAGAILVALLLGHQLRAVNMIFILVLIPGLVLIRRRQAVLVLQPILVSVLIRGQRNPGQ